MNCKPAIQLWLPFVKKGEQDYSEIVTESPSLEVQLMERVVCTDNMFKAYRHVLSNGGSPGIDGMTVKELGPYLQAHWPEVREALLSGVYEPQPVKRVNIPKPGGGTRKLGVPTAVDRLIQQAVLQVLQPEWDPTFSPWSFGFRPGRSAHQALRCAQKHLRSGYGYVVDMDLEKFFDRVNHDKLMGEVVKRVSDGRVVTLIRRFLKAGVLDHDCLHETVEGTPQGGPLSPLLSNLLLDQLDRELERRGHRFARYADDCNIYVKSLRAGRRVLESISRYLTSKLKLKVNEAKSAVGRPWERKFLGFSFSRRGFRLFVSESAEKRFKEKIREITGRTRGRSIRQVAKELRVYLLGWREYFGHSEVRSGFKELDSWIRRRLRSDHWKQWGRRCYRELRKRGVSRRLAWNTAKSAHGPWRLSRSPALAFALPGKYFDELGVPRLYIKR